jgi:hypothetical protein
MASYAYASNNPISRVDEDGLLDWKIGCKSGGKSSWYARLPGNTPCDDCKALTEAAATFCAMGAVGNCSCAELQKTAEKACKGCQSKQPPPEKPPRPPSPRPSNLFSCK